MKHLGKLYFWRGALRGCVLGALLNKHAFWIGLHYSRHCRRYCLNIVPFVTVWLALEGGSEP